MVGIQSPVGHSFVGDHPEHEPRKAGMIEVTIDDIRLLRFERLTAEAGIAHGVTTRPQNMAPHRGVDADQAVAWRRRLCAAMGCDYERLTSPAQVHGGEVLRVVACDVGRGRDGRGSAVPYVDGLVCDTPGVPMIFLSADCPLVWVYDASRHAVGVVHASWQGTVARAAENLVRQMVRSFGSDPGKLVAGIAPSAGPCCYEVGEEVRRIAQTRLDNADACFTPRGDKFMFDMWAANRRQLIGSGVPADAIEVAGLCSMCDERFWSHRRDRKDAGRFGMFVCLE